MSLVYLFPCIFFPSNYIYFYLDLFLMCRQICQNFIQCSIETNGSIMKHIFTLFGSLHTLRSVVLKNNSLLTVDINLINKLRISWRIRFHILTQSEEFFLLSGFSFTKFHNIYRTAVEGGGICLTPLYQFHQLQRRLDISRVITSGSSPLHR